MTKQSFRKINKIDGIPIAFDRINVDTDQIIPSDFCKNTGKTGYGVHLFHYWRYLNGNMDCPDPGFILNDSTFKAANILLTRENFGCGSSREAAPWALWEYGFRCLIGVSYSEIFYNNCINNGILIFTLESEKINDLFKSVEANAGMSMNINLIKQEVITPEGNSMHFEIGEFHKFCLVNGIDQIDWTLQFEDLIIQHEKKVENGFPWLSLKSDA